jgi:hypothetical protein
MLTRFRLSWKNYVFQSFLATLSIFFGAFILEYRACCGDSGDRC